MESIILVPVSVRGNDGWYYASLGPLWVRVHSLITETGFLHHYCSYIMHPTPSVRSTGAFNYCDTWVSFMDCHGGGCTRLIIPSSTCDQLVTYRGVWCCWRSFLGIEDPTNAGHVIVARFAYCSFYRSGLSTGFVSSRLVHFVNIDDRILYVLWETHHIPCVRL